MRNLFPGYYRPTDNELKELWEKATFIVDANVLLNCIAILKMLEMICLASLIKHLIVCGFRFRLL